MTLEYTQALSSNPAPSIKPLYTEVQIKLAIREMAAELTAKYEDTYPIVIAVLEGARPFARQMLQYLEFPLEVETIKASSYSGFDRSRVKVDANHLPETYFENRPIIYLEDIIDTGWTIHHLARLSKKYKARSTEVYALLNKPERRETDLNVPINTAFNVPNVFVVGYGLDYDGLYRELPYVGVIH